MKRRTFLTSMAAVGATGLSGCASGGKEAVEDGIEQSIEYDVSVGSTGDYIVNIDGSTANNNVTGPYTVFLQLVVTVNGDKVGETAVAVERVESLTTVDWSHTFVIPGGEAEDVKSINVKVVDESAKLKDS